MERFGLAQEYALRCGYGPDRCAPPEQGGGETRECRRHITAGGAAHPAGPLRVGPLDKYVKHAADQAL
jgi:hypothetical protein